MLAVIIWLVGFFSIQLYKSGAYVCDIRDFEELGPMYRRVVWSMRAIALVPSGTSLWVVR